MKFTVGMKVIYKGVCDSEMNNRIGIVTEVGRNIKTDKHNLWVKFESDSISFTKKGFRWDDGEPEDDYIIPLTKLGKVLE